MKFFHKRNKTKNENIVKNKILAQNVNKAKKEKKPFTLKLDMTIKVQLMIGFLIPIIFIIVVGMVAYTKASQGLTNNYEKSAATALEMLVETFDEATGQIQSIVSELAQDTTVKAYGLGGLEKQGESATATAKQTIRNNINVKLTSGSYVQNIHIFPVQDLDIFTTQHQDTISEPSFINEFAGTEDEALLNSKRITWGTKHPCIDNGLKIDSSSYTMFCSMRFSSGKLQGLVVTDVSTESVMELMRQLDFGEGAMVSLITSQGVEYPCDHETAISDTAFFQENLSSEETLYSEYVTYNNKQYLFMMCRSAKTGAYFTVLIPEANILESTREIRNITVLLIAIACVIAVILGYVIISNITRNIQRSVMELDKVSKGELFVETKKKKARNEFGKLQGALTNTVIKMRELVLTVKRMTEEVAASGQSVGNSSENVGSMVTDMSNQVKEILNTIHQEDEEVIQCSEKMEMLSVNIETVSNSISTTIDEVDHSKKIIAEGMQVVENMTRQSKETTAVTDEVQKQVLLLSEKLGNITQAVENIQEIASQTNLLSLNASIEAARAGEHGRGFSVVAEEIRKLADDSASMAVSIQQTITEIQDYSDSTIEKVKKAEDIVTIQESSVQNTAEAFRNINGFMEKLIESMQAVSGDVSEMNRKRSDVLHSIHMISKLSEDTVQAAQGVGAALENQVDSAKDLEKEAQNLQENMKELEAAISSFKLDKEM